MVKKKGMPIDIGIKRLSILKNKGLISDQVFSDSKELLFQSEMKIPTKESTWFDNFYIKNNSKIQFKNVRISKYLRIIDANYREAVGW